LLAIAVLFVTVYVTTSNTISDRQTKLATLQTQVAQVRTEAASLSHYVSFEQLAKQRVATVRQIVASRFDWQAALSSLSKVVPANTSLQSLLATVAPGASVSGAGGSTGGLRAAINVPAFELKGCTHTQDDVASLMSRLRLINGVTRVTLSDSQKAAGAQPGATVTSTSSSGASSAGGCPATGPSFDLVIFFSPLPGAGPDGVTSAATSTTTPVAGAATSTPTTATTSSSTPTTATTSSSTGQPVSGATTTGASR
jgi:Tfp pilus assembly protein PilN